MADPWLEELGNLMFVFDKVYPTVADIFVFDSKRPVAETPRLKLGVIDMILELPLTKACRVDDRIS